MMKGFFDRLLIPGVAMNRATAESRARFLARVEREIGGI